jgi:hypothetical protein
MTDRPSAAARAWDAAALVLVAAGTAVVLRAHEGLKGIQAAQIHAATIEAPNITRWVHYRTMSNIGFAMIAGGVVVGVVAWYRSRREQARARALPVVIPDAPIVSEVPPNAPRG